MKKLSIFFWSMVVSAMLMIPDSAFAISLKFDFYGGDTSYTKGTFEDPQGVKLPAGKTVQVDVWLTEWTPAKNVGAIDWKFKVLIPACIEIKAHECNNRKPNGQWSVCEFNDTVSHETLVVQMETSAGIAGPNIQLATFTVRGKTQGESMISAVKEAISDVDGKTVYTVDEAKVQIGNK